MWTIDLAESATRLRALCRLLSNDEEQRARQLKLERHRRHWIVGRAMLRTILSCYVGVPPEVIRFEFSDHGKPALALDDVLPRVHFNLAHSNELALLAVTDIGPVGVDLEWMKEIDDMDAVVRRFFSRSEQKIFDKLANEQRLAAFYTCWTRKEAFLKALGCGLSRPTDSFDVEFQPDAAPAIVAIDGCTRSAANWVLPLAHFGCLIVSTALLAGSAGPVIKSRVQVFRQQMHARFVGALTRRSPATS